MKLSILVLMAAILLMSTSIEIEVSQYLYETLVVQPKQCMEQYCSNEIKSVQNSS